MIQMTATQAIVSMCSFFFLGALLTAVTTVIVYRTRAKIKDNEISGLVRKIAGNELVRRNQAEAIRQISLRFINMKQSVRKILKRYSQMSKSNFGKEIKGVIDE